MRGWIVIGICRRKYTRLRACGCKETDKVRGRHAMQATMPLRNNAMGDNGPPIVYIFLSHLKSSFVFITRWKDCAPLSILFISSPKSWMSPRRFGIKHWSELITLSPGSQHPRGASTLSDFAYAEEYNNGVSRGDIFSAGCNATWNHCFRRICIYTMNNKLSTRRMLYKLYIYTELKMSLIVVFWGMQKFPRVV